MLTKCWIIVAVLMLCCLALVNAQDCSNYNGENGCQGDQTNQYPAFATRAFQTPERGTPLWRETYQDYSHLVGYASIVYDSDRTKAEISANVFCQSSGPNATCSDVTYSFAGKPSTSTPTYMVDTTDHGPVTVVVKDSQGHTLEMDPVDLLWDVPTLLERSSAYQDGQKGAIIEMFGWPHKDIAAECEMIGKAGYLGVKVFPPQESLLTWEWLQNGELNPWYWLYQPVSYKLTGRQGSVDDLRMMIAKCRKAGVRVYADAVVNHATGGGNDVLEHRNAAGSSCAYWGAKNGTAGSPFMTQDFNFAPNANTKQHPGLEFPAIPYFTEHFHCERPLNSWNDPLDLNAGWLVGLSDLNTELEYVQQRIADYLTALLSIGFSGVRIDAAKHIQPADLTAIFGKLAKNMGGSLPTDFIAYLEVLMGGEKDLLMCNEGPYDYGVSLQTMLGTVLSQADVQKIKIWESAYPKEFPICGDWVIDSTRMVAENDCADDQNPGSSSRDMGDKGSVLVLAKDVPVHRQFEQQLFTRTDGNWQIKLVLSSYTFMDNGAMGPPDGLSDCSRCNGTAEQCAGCKSVPYTPAHDPNVCGYTVYDTQGNWAQGSYTRVHRDKSIIMAMRQWQGLSDDVTNADLGLPPQCN
jgi:alpha-amylase